MSKKKIAVNVFLSCLCVFVFASALNAASDNSGNHASSPNCTTVGEIQERYTADRGCGYTTHKRTCCKDKLWSAWGEACPPDSEPTLKVERSVSDWTSVTCSGVRTCACLVNNYYANMGPLKPTIQPAAYPKCSGTVDNNFCNDKEEGYTCYESINTPTWSDELGNWTGTFGGGGACQGEYRSSCEIPCPCGTTQGGREIVKPCDRTLWTGTMNTKFNLVTCVLNNA